MTKRLPVAMVLLLAGCGGAVPAPAVPVAGDASVEPDPSAAEPRTAYRAGDFVVYRYEGTALEGPVELREEVLEQDGLRLTIEVTATRGDESRRWIQVVTDTNENRNNDVIDELYVFEGGERRRLENANNEDVFRLYGWIVPPLCKGSSQRAVREEREVVLAGQPFACRCKRDEQVCGGRPASSEACDCDDFLWTHAEGTIVDAESDETLWMMRVVEHGRRTQ